MQTNRTRFLFVEIVPCAAGYPEAANQSLAAGRSPDVWRQDLNRRRRGDNLNHSRNHYRFSSAEGGTHSMAGRKRTLDRRQMRAYDEEEPRTEGEEAEETEDEEEGEEGEEEAEGEAEEEADGEAAPVADDEEEVEIVKPKKKKKAAVKAPAKSRSRTAKHVRLKVVWGVFDNSNKQVETFPFNQEEDAKALATKLATDKKQTFFVQKVKKPFEDK